MTKIEKEERISELEVPDINYGQVSAYNIQAWQNVYNIDLNTLVNSDNQ